MQGVQLTACPSHGKPLIYTIKAGVIVRAGHRASHQGGAGRLLKLQLPKVQIAVCTLASGRQLLL
jgi:hypothetical protein